MAADGILDVLRLLLRCPSRCLHCAPWYAVVAQGQPVAGPQRVEIGRGITVRVCAACCFWLTHLSPAHAPMLPPWLLVALALFILPCTSPPHSCNQQCPHPRCCPAHWCRPRDSRLACPLA
jgi:hypothetical protein